MIEDNKDRIVEALHRDMHKHRQEAAPVEVSGIQTSCLYALRNLAKWTTDEKPMRRDPFNLIGGARIKKEPKGVGLIIGAWNYPFMEIFEPMISAIAAGCSMILKPSELASASQDLIAEMVPMYLDESAIRVITAGPDEMQYLLDKSWGHIFFTGSTTIGRVVATKAAARLTTVTLELGGRNPAIVSATANIDLAAKRIAAAKFMNAGQVRVSPKYLLLQNANSWLTISVDLRDRQSCVC